MPTFDVDGGRVKQSLNFLFPQNSTFLDTNYLLNLISMVVLPFAVVKVFFLRYNVLYIIFHYYLFYWFLLLFIFHKEPTL
jgi:hypothetical protein